MVRLTLHNDEQKIHFYVCIPVYNVQGFLEECIESVIKQSYRQFEIILVDDGSTDNSGTICDYYAKNYNFIHVVHQKNKGLFLARKKAFEFCLHLYQKSNYDAEQTVVVSLDSDDTLKENTLKIIANYFIENKNIDTVIYGMDRLIENKIVENPHHKLEIITDKSQLYWKVFTNSKYNSICRKATKIRTIDLNYLPDGRKINRTEDLLHSIPIYKNSNAVVFVPENLYNYRLNPNSITQSINPLEYRTDFFVREKVDDFLIEENVWNYKKFYEYSLYCQKIIKDEVQKILSFNINIEEKKNLLLTLKDNPYVRKHIENSSQTKGLDLYLLRKKKFKALVFFNKGKSIFRSSLNIFRRTL